MLFSLLDEKKAISSRLGRLLAERERLKAFGSLDPASVDELRRDGYDLHFYTLRDKEYERIKDDEGYTCIPLSLGKKSVIMTINSTLPVKLGIPEFSLGEKSLDDVEKEIGEGEVRLAEINGIFKRYVPYIDAWQKKIAEKNESILFENVKSSTAEDEDIIYITGYIPEKYIDLFKKSADASSWAYLISEISDDDNPPSLVKYPGFIRIVKPVFSILGVVPGYREYDISTYFLLFFSIFFAMIIGDAGYGFIFLLLAVIMNIKSRKASDLNILVYVLSISTLIWGALTGTYFGSEAILNAVPFLKKLIIPAISNFPELVGADADWAQNMVMKFCFILGASQLSLACVLNIIHKVQKKDISLLADLGWLIDVLVLYLLVLFLVIGEPCPVNLVVGGVVTGFILVCVFSGQGPGVPFLTGLKAGLGGFFTTFLDTVSCFSNIMSYIRLFAVGMASLAIAQSFNQMGAGFLPLGVIVIILGHALNLAMGVLSVVVHGVRLNLLEFSGQLGMEWSGYEYEPFKKASNE